MRKLIRRAKVIVTMDQNRAEFADADILIENGTILDVGQDLGPADEILNAEGCVVSPGLINTHHHLFQNLTRATPGGQDASLFNWLKSNYRIWSRLRPSDIQIAAKLGLAELAVSGCSHSSDHLYLFPNGTKLEDTIEAAETIGLRFHPTRGSMSIGESQGGLPPDALTENEDDILDDCIRVLDEFNDSNLGAMVRVGLAPCSPFTVSQELMRLTVELARDKGATLHTHLAENQEDIDYSVENFGCRPGEYAERLGWLGDDVWHAHCVMLDAKEIGLFANSGTGVAHCPGSNCRLGSGIAPVRQMLDRNVAVGLGVDGSSSNDSASLIGEARQAMLLQRVTHGAGAMSARKALEIATVGGAKVLGRNDVGVIAPGMRADIAVWDVSSIEYSGAWDPVAALILCGPKRVRDLYVDGRKVVSEGNLVTMDENELVEQHTAATINLMNG